MPRSATRDHKLFQAQTSFLKLRQAFSLRRESRLLDSVSVVSWLARGQ